jgi:hypothetical protein
MSFKRWLTGKSEAEQRVDELDALVHKLRERKLELQGKIADRRLRGLDTSAYDDMYAATCQMYDHTRAMLQEALAIWKAEL